MLQQFVGNECIRQLIDYGNEPPFLVLEHLESDALRYSGEARISRQDIKFIARNILSALRSLHAKGIAHTGKTMPCHPATSIYADPTWLKTLNQTTCSLTSMQRARESWKLSWLTVVSLNRCLASTAPSQCLHYIAKATHVMLVSRTTLATQLTSSELLSFEALKRCWA